MSDPNLLARYNYDAFVPANFEPWMRFDESPPLGRAGPDFPLWSLDEAATRLSAVWAQAAYSVVEFGSFT